MWSRGRACEEGEEVGKVVKEETQPAGEGPDGITSGRVIMA